MIQSFFVWLLGPDLSIIALCLFLLLVFMSPVIWAEWDCRRELKK